MDYIKIKNLEVFARHGVLPEENKLGQKFLISAYLYIDTKEAGKADDLSKSIHYGEVCSFIHDYVKDHTFQLIESVAEQLAEQLLHNLSRLKEVEIEVKKPWAPIGLPLEAVSVKIRRKWHTVYIALGSNIGDKKAHLDFGIESICNHADCRVKKVSSYIETEPYGETNQDHFLNACAELETLKTPEELLECLHQIEQQAGRERKVRWGPRTLDIDIIFYDDLIKHTEKLQIPHIDMHNREFVIAPLKEIAPYVIHPIFHKYVIEL